MNKSKIEWCDSTWNPVTGCYHNCEYCYARKIAKRFGGWKFTPGMIAMNVADDDTYTHPMKRYYGEAAETEYGKIADITDPFLKENHSKAPYPFGFTPTFHRYRLNEYEKKKGRTIFVCSMADLFGKWVPDSWIEEVFAACEKVPQHRYLFLTKNPQRYAELARAGKLPQRDNMWYGSTVTAVENYFSSKKTFNTFLSIEPLFSPISPLTITDVKWLVIGAETGNRKNKVIPKKEWIDNIVQYADNTRLSVFMKDSLIPIVGEENMRREFPWGKDGD